MVVGGGGRVTLITLLATALLFTPNPPSLAVFGEIEELGRSCTRWLFAGELEKIRERLGPDMRRQMDANHGLDELRTRYRKYCGEEIEVVTERVFTEGDALGYLRTARVKASERTWDLVWSFDDKAAIIGFRLKPSRTAAPTALGTYVTKTRLALPVAGEWTVVWGGRTLADNYHSVTTDQHYAIDLTITVDGREYRGDGKRNEDYFCFGQPVRAPAAGRVVEAADGIPDNEPGKKNFVHPFGNHVVIDHGNGEFSILAHFQRGSVVPAPGRGIEAGELLGRCGNSGSSSAPHLHYHLQDGPTSGKGRGLPASFEDYVANGEEVTRGEPVRGQRIRQK